MLRREAPWPSVSDTQEAFPKTAKPKTEVPRQAKKQTLIARASERASEERERERQRRTLSLHALDEVRTRVGLSAFHVFLSFFQPILYRIIFLFFFFFFKFFNLEILWNVLLIDWNLHFLDISGKKKFKRPIIAADLGEK